MKKIIDIIRTFFFEKTIDRIDTKNFNFDHVFAYNARWMSKDNLLDRIRRNQLVRIIRKVRAKHPFQPKDFSKAEQMYKDYFKMEGHINSREEIISKLEEGEKVYVVRFRNDIPVKGRRYANYYINGEFLSEDSERAFRVKLSDTDGDHLPMFNPVDEHYSRSFPQEFTNYRYATEREITIFERCEEAGKHWSKIVEERMKVVEQACEVLSELRLCKLSEETKI